MSDYACEVKYIFVSIASSFIKRFLDSSLTICYLSAACSLLLYIWLFSMFSEICLNSFTK